MKIFIGYDPREVEAYHVCDYSLRKHAKEKLDITPIVKGKMMEEGLFWRKDDPLQSTEFTYTRFLVPKLMGYKGWALFVDCDFLFTVDIAELFRLADDRYAVMCVHHDYTPQRGVKMDGKPQTSYPRKNWSSLVLWNCGHESNETMSPLVVNSAPPSFLHRFEWLENNEIGKIPEEWNFLIGDYREPEQIPKGLHFTYGIPVQHMGNAVQSNYNDLWLNTYKEYKEWLENGYKQENVGVA